MSTMQARKSQLFQVPVGFRQYKPQLAHQAVILTCREVEYLFRLMRKLRRPTVSYIQCSVQLFEDPIRKSDYPYPQQLGDQKHTSPTENIHGICLLHCMGITASLLTPTNQTMLHGPTLQSPILKFTKCIQSIYDRQ